VCKCGGREVGAVAHGVELSICLDVFCELDCYRGQYRILVGCLKSILVSPASPENAIKVCLFRDRVLSSDAFRIVAPLIAALEQAMRVKSLPVIPSKTSL